MKIQPANYADFVTVIRAISGLEAIFYFEVSPTDFRYWAFLNDGGTWVSPGSFSAKPATFDADFPNATGVTAILSVFV